MQAQKRAILQRISIHAPARGATRSLFRIAKAGSYFNPRSREGSDVNPLPRRGASIRFQSTLPRGERQNSSTVATRSWIFQSTLPRGERLDRPHFVWFLHYNFNPRSREGSDFVLYSPSFLCTYFNPRSREGSDCIRARHIQGFRISIHAPARGATSILSKIHPMFLTISHNASSFSSFPFHSFLPHLLNSSTFCALFQVRISRAFSVYYRFAPKKSTPDL